MKLKFETKPAFMVGIVLCILTLGGLLIWQIWPGGEMTPERPDQELGGTEPDVTFQLSEYQEPTKGYGYGIKSQIWRGDILEVVAFEALYGCAESKTYYEIIEDYYGEGKDLLRFYLREFGERDNYKSDYDITFRLGSIERKDYEIMVFTEHIDSSLFCYEEWERILSQAKQYKFCQGDEDCLVLACGCYNNNIIVLRDEYKEKGCQIPRYACITSNCICLDNQCQGYAEMSH